MAIINLTPEELKQRYQDIKKVNTGTERAKRTNKAHDELVGVVKTLVDIELNSEEFKTAGKVQIAPADLGEAIYDDWKDLVGKSKAPTKAARVKAIGEVISEYCEEKNCDAKNLSKGKKGVRTVFEITPKVAPKKPAKK